MKNIKIAIVDDHPSVRYGIRSVLEKEEDFDVVGEFDCANSFLKAEFDSDPDVLILDVSLPDISGLNIIEKAEKKVSGMRIVMLSMYCRSDYILQAIQNGVSGYITKETPPENLVLGIRQILSGEYYFDRQTMDLLLKRIAEKPAKIFNHSDSNYAKLTSREQEILQLLAQGFTPEEISGKLFISKRTVENYRTNILKKLELEHSIELVYYAQKLGII